MRLVLLTTFALTAFAFNSILCRWALGSESIDPASFTGIRMLSGAITLGLILVFRNRGREVEVKSEKNLLSGFILFAYAILFSFAYTTLSTGTGALILFGSVQLTMFAVTLFSGEKPKLFEWVGLGVAFTGLVYLVFPGVSAPSPLSAVLMAGSGIAWGFYTLKGKGVADPIATNSGNFIWATLMMAVFFVLPALDYDISWFGVAMAVLSGAVASGIGYSVWYAALKDLHSATAAVLQLSVPLIAAVGGIVIIGEALTIRLPIAGLLILGGIFAAIRARST